MGDTRSLVALVHKLSASRVKVKTADSQFHVDIRPLSRPAMVPADRDSDEFSGNPHTRRPCLGTRVDNTTHTLPLQRQPYDF